MKANIAAFCCICILLFLSLSFRALGNFKCVVERNRFDEQSNSTTLENDLETQSFSHQL